MNRVVALAGQSASTDVYRIDDLKIDAGRRVVTRGDVTIPLPKLSFDLLLVLIRAAPNVVSIDEFMQRVWPGLVVSPETISQRVKLLRDAIGDDARSAKYIAGVRGLGYRLIPDVAREVRGAPAKVTDVPSREHPPRNPEALTHEPALPGSPEVSTHEPAVPGSPEVSTHEPAPPGRPELSALESPPQAGEAIGVGAATATGVAQPTNRGAAEPLKSEWRRSTIILVTLGLTLLAAIGAGLLRHHYHQANDFVVVESAATRAVAVMPFDNISKGHEDDYIALGLAEMVLNRLSAVPSLQVIARTSSFAVRAKNLDVKEIGHLLNADYLVQGSLQRNGDSLRVTAQLIDVASGRQFKALHFDKSLKDIFSIEDEIADSVAASLALRMGDAPQFHPEQARNVSLSAYLEYLQGRASLGHFRSADLETAVQHFNRAIAIDPQFAAAYSSLADAERWLKMEQRELDADARTEILALTNKAIALDGGLGEAYVVRASLEENDVHQAEADFRKGLDLSPSFGLGYTYFAETLMDWNRNEEAGRVIDHSIAIDPLSPRATYIKAVWKEQVADSVNASREARALMASVLTIDPTFTNALVRIAEYTAVDEGKFAEAIRLTERALQADPGAEWIREDAVAMYGELNEGTAARNLTIEAGDHFYYGRLHMAGYDGDWHKAAQLEFERPERLKDTDLDLPPILAMQIYGHQTHEFERCIADLRSRYHLKEGHEFDDSMDAGLAVARLLEDKGDMEAARQMATRALETVDQAAALPSGLFSAHLYRAKSLLILGNNDAALRELEIGAHSDVRPLFPFAWSIKFDTAWDPIRDDPRFHALMDLQQSYINDQRALLEAMRRKGEIPLRDIPARTQNEHQAQNN